MAFTVFYDKKRSHVDFFLPEGKWIGLAAGRKNEDSALARWFRGTKFYSVESYGMMVGGCVEGERTE